MNGKTQQQARIAAQRILRLPAKLELTGTGTVKSTDIAVNSSVVRVGDNNGEARSVELVIGKDVVIESPNSYGVGAFGPATTEKLTIYGTIKSTATTNESYDGTRSLNTRQSCALRYDHHQRRRKDFSN